MSGKYALIIGNTEYADPGLAQLSAPGKDAEDLARVLNDKDICAFDKVNILLNQLSSTVVEAIDEFFDQKKPDDLLLLYFSGHGVRDEIGSLYLAVQNTIRSRLRSTAIKSDYVRDAMNQSRSRRQVVILDCCNSGAFPQGTKAEVGGTMGMISAFQGYGRYVLTASDEVQFAWEGNNIIGETENSLFTHFLLRGLEGEADSDSDGRVTVDELYDYAYEQISRITPKQTPRKDASKQEGEIVLRQFTRVEDIRPVPLREDLISEIEDLRPYVREIAVQKLEKILKGKNIGLARSAREALERIASEDDSRRVSQAATQILESLRQLEQKAEEERKAKEETERIAMLKAEEERLAREKAEVERRAREEAERKTAKYEAARLKAEREAAERAVHAAAEKAAKEKEEKEAAERTAIRLEAERMANRERMEREAAEKAAKEQETLENAEWGEGKTEEQPAAISELPASAENISLQSFGLVFWIIVGWAISWVVGWVIGGAAGGLIGRATGWESGGQSSGLLDYVIGWVLGGTIGSASAWVIGREREPASAEVADHIIGGAIGGVIGGFIGGAIGGAIPFAISFTIGGTIGGAIGGLVMMWQFTEER